MKRHRILHIVGARPHFMKLAPISRAITGSPDFEEVTVHTGQHYTEELSDLFIREFDLNTPDYQLKVGSATHNRQIGQIILELDDILRQEHPDIVFVYGDTNTTAAGAIAAAKSHIPLAHVEAGLREWNKAIPEEVNKLITDAVSDLYFCPTQTAVSNLSRQGITANVFNTGDTVIDWIVQNTASIRSAEDVLHDLGLTKGHYYILTCHRASNTNHAEPLRQILSAVTLLEMPVVFPVHPRTRMAIDKRKYHDLLGHSNVVDIAPQGFWNMQALIRNAKAVITDSGGLIKEAYHHKVPCVIIDLQTEWVESVNEGWAMVAGPDAQAIMEAVARWKKPVRHSGFLGHGHAADAILEHTRKYLSSQKSPIH